MFKKIKEGLRKISGIDDWKGLTEFEHIRMVNAVVTSFRQGLKGGSFMMLLNGTSIITLMANATPFYFLAAILLRLVKDKVDNVKNIKELNFRTEFLVTGIFSIMNMIGVWYCIEVLMTKVIIDYLASPLINKIQNNYTNYIKSNIYRGDETSLNIVETKITHIYSIVGVVSYAIYGGVLALSKIGRLDMSTVFKILITVNSIVIWYMVRYICIIQRERVI